MNIGAAANIAAATTSNAIGVRVTVPAKRRDEVLGLIQDAYAKAVTDWERRRYFEQI